MTSGRELRYGERALDGLLSPAAHPALPDDRRDLPHTRAHVIDVSSECSLLFIPR